MTEELPLCGCGCRLRVTKPGNRFINGHNWQGKSHTSETKKKMVDAHTDVPRPPEVCDAISAAHKDVPLSPEHIAAITKGCKNSDAVKAEAERQRGGHDLVNHHYIYDHNDLLLNTVQMTRKDHQKLHMLLQKLGYIVPHINSRECCESPYKITNNEINSINELNTNNHSIKLLCVATK